MLVAEVGSVCLGLWTAPVFKALHGRRWVDLSYSCCLFDAGQSIEGVVRQKDAAKRKRHTAPSRDAARRSECVKVLDTLTSGTLADLPGGVGRNAQVPALNLLEATWPTFQLARKWGGGNTSCMEHFPVDGAGFRSTGGG